MTDGIDRVTADGIVTTDGQTRKIDVLVCATGFETGDLLASVRVTGLQGRTLRETWKDGPEAFHGIAVAGFPNMFLMLGPNTATGHTSTLLFIEPAVKHAIACMRAVRASQQKWIAVRPEVMQAHNQRMQQRLAGSVWSLCRSWYRTDSGRIVAIFPGFTSEYVKSLRRFNRDDYLFG